jgi:hypothetical protein
MTLTLKRPRSVAALVFAMAGLCALLLALPGETVTTKYLNDLFIFLDGVHRIDQGQIPNRDFHTALGPLVYYIPVLGYWLSGTFGGAMPVGMAILVVAMAPIAAHALGSRLRPMIGLPLAAFLLLVLAVPINIGESIGALSFGMFYNRIGWAALGILLVLHLHPLRPGRSGGVLDTLCATALILLMLYTKISYALVGLAFLVLLLLDSKQRRWAAAALVAVPLGAYGVELAWGGTLGHVEDLRLASRVSGSLAQINDLVAIVFRNLSDFVLYTLIAVLVLWRTRSIRHLLYFGFCAGSGWALISQNFQQTGVVTLGVGAAVAAEMLARSHAAQPTPRSSVTTGAHLLLLAMLLPMTLHNAAALGLHSTLATVRHGDPVPLERFEGVRLARLWFDGPYPYPMFVRYMASLRDGAAALGSVDGGAERVVVLDFVNPFTAGLGLKPPQGDSTWHHWGRTINEESFLPAEELFRDVRLVMEPKWAVEESTATGMRQIYADHLSDRYEVAVETADWRIHVSRPSPAETVSRSPASDPEPESARPASGG